MALSKGWDSAKLGESHFLLAGNAAGEAKRVLGIGSAPGASGEHFSPLRRCNSASAEKLGCLPLRSQGLILL
jgi:hypothetical protein